jgi:hypothetical protein
LKNMGSWKGIMKSSEKTEKGNSLDLEGDLPWAQDVFEKRARGVPPGDLAAYLEFLEEIKAFEAPEEKRRFYDAVFEL